MARPHKERLVGELPSITHFKPVGVPMMNIDEIIMSFDEMEALRLADLQQLDQATAAEMMGISRPTFHRLVTKAHEKVATALWQGKALTIEGGSYKVSHLHKDQPRSFVCRECSHEWSVPHGNGQSGRDMSCPSCNAQAVMRKQ